MPRSLWYLFPPGDTHVPFFTSTLDPSVPDVTYHIYIKRDPAGGRAELHYYKAKSDAKIGPGEGERQTLYVLKASKEKRFQIPSTTLHRASEFTTPCVQVLIAGVRLRFFSGGHDLMQTGRAMQFHNGSGSVIREEPDRRDRKGWGPRRFRYGGRQFVWVTEGGNEGVPQTLYEVGEGMAEGREQDWEEGAQDCGCRRWQQQEVVLGGA